MTLEWISVLRIRMNTHHQNHIHFFKMRYNFLHIRLGLIESPTFIPFADLIQRSFYILWASTCTVTESAPAFWNASTCWIGSWTIRCPSMNCSVASWIDAITGIPNEMLGTNIPSMTSKWIYSAPLSSVFPFPDPKLWNPPPVLTVLIHSLSSVPPLILQFLIHFYIILITDLMNLSSSKASFTAHPGSCTWSHPLNRHIPSYSRNSGNKYFNSSFS